MKNVLKTCWDQGGQALKGVKYYYPTWNVAGSNLVKAKKRKSTQSKIWPYSKLVYVSERRRNYRLIFRFTSFICHFKENCKASFKNGDFGSFLSVIKASRPGWTKKLPEPKTAAFLGIGGPNQIQRCIWFFKDAKNLWKLRD